MMIKCSECGKKFSDNASACPHCGCPISKQVSVSPKPPMNSDTKKKIIAVIIGAVVIVGIVLFCVIQQNIADKSAKETMNKALYGNNSTSITNVSK